MSSRHLAPSRSSASAAFIRSVLGVLCLGAVMVALPACADRDAQPAPTGLASGRPVDATLIAFLSKARAAHHLADLAEAKGQRPVAIRELRRVTEGARPEGSPEVTEVLADTYARLADLLGQEGDPKSALAEVDRGLALATEVTHFRGHLFEIRGVVLEREMHRLEQAGELAAAKDAREAALTAFSTAMQVQEQVIELALPPAGSASPLPETP